MDMKLEVVVIPVADVDRAKEFLRQARLAARRRLRRERGVSGRAVHASRLAVLDPLRQGGHVGRTRLGTRTFPRRVRHRGGARRPHRPRCRRGRGVPPFARGGAGEGPGSGAAQLRLVRDVQRSGRQRVAVAGGHLPIARTGGRGAHDLHLARRAHRRAAPRRSRARRVREAPRPPGCRMAGLVRPLHDRRAGRQRRCRREGGRHDDLRCDHHRHRAGRARAGAAAGRRRHEGGDRRARPLRRHLRQHRLHADQDAGRQRLCHARRAPRRRLRVQRRRHHGRHEARQGAQGRGRRRFYARRRAVAARPGELHGLHRPRAAPLAARGRGRQRGPAGGEDLPQCRRPRRGARHSRPRPGRLPHQQLDDGRRFPAAAISWCWAAATSGSSSARCIAASAARSRSSSWGRA